MSIKKIASVFFAVATMFFKPLGAEIRTTNKDCEYIFSGVYKPETFYGKNINWLNNDNPFDKAYLSRHTLDLTFDVLYGQQTYEQVVAEFLFQMRNKAVWGSPESYGSTMVSDIKDLGVVRGAHSHGLPRLFFSIRQAWLQFTINQAVNLPFSNKHTFTIGAFPFEVGRGIALGDAYATGPEVFGFYADSAIDQYAFGAKFSGDILARKLSYDWYTAILQNNSSSINSTEKKIFGQEFGKLNNPERGFGSVHYAMAGRLNWKVFDNETLGKMILEPYAVYSSDPEQRVSFPADASTKLGTLGFAGEFYGSRFEAGFDYAVNLGQQRVRGWDRNTIIEANREGQIVLVNSQVNATYSVNDVPVTEQAPYVPLVGKDPAPAQTAINTTDKDENQNGMEIDKVPTLGYLTSGPITLNNGAVRFRNAYTNKFEGWMFVADAAVNLLQKDLQLAATVGIASGDDNPNFETKDGEYSGFIPLQSVYSGKRVRSPFVLGGAGKLKRLLSSPGQFAQSPSKEAQGVSGLTNLIFTGAALKWKPKAWVKPFEINPNILAFWQERQIGNARTYLGLETSLFVNYSMLKDLKFFWVSSLFFPGSHYADRKGAPVLTPAQLAMAGNQERTGNTQDRIAKLGNDVAYTFNLGLIYSF